MVKRHVKKYVRTAAGGIHAEFRPRTLEGRGSSFFGIFSFFFFSFLFFGVRGSTHVIFLFSFFLTFVCTTLSSSLFFACVLHVYDTWRWAKRNGDRHSPASSTPPKDGTPLTEPNLTGPRVEPSYCWACLASFNESFPRCFATIIRYHSPASAPNHALRWRVECNISWSSVFFGCALIGGVGGAERYTG